MGKSKWYIIEDVFYGNIEQFRDTFFSNANPDDETLMREFALEEFNKELKIFNSFQEFDEYMEKVGA